jgi:hypothetical protein
VNDLDRRVKSLGLTFSWWVLNHCLQRRNDLVGIGRNSEVGELATRPLTGLSKRGGFGEKRMAIGALASFPTEEVEPAP